MVVGLCSDHNSLHVYETSCLFTVLDNHSCSCDVCAESDNDGCEDQNNTEDDDSDAHSMYLCLCLPHPLCQVYPLPGSAAPGGDADVRTAAELKLHVVGDTDQGAGVVPDQGHCLVGDDGVL